MYIQYLTPMHHSILIRPLLTVPDAPDGEYQFAGVPDGLGAFALSGTVDTFELLVTHELRHNAGKRRLHACSGAFVSRWTIDTTHWRANRGKGRIGVTSGRDQIRCVHHWVHQNKQYSTSTSVPIERLCSADLPTESALAFQDDQGTEYGTRERIFLGGEETHTRFKLDHGRAFAHLLTGPRDGHSYELPHLGRASFENALACPFPQRKTIVMLPDDAESHRVFDADEGDEKPRQEPDPCATRYDHYHPPSELYVYVGEKQTPEKAAQSGYPLEISQAGLVDGTLFGVQVQLDGKAVKWEHREYGFGTKKYVGKAEFRLVNLGDRSKPVPLRIESKDGCEEVAQDNPGIALQRDSIRFGVTQFLRPEDGTWDPRPDHQHEFYFGTTDKFEGNSRLFRLTFNDLSRVGEEEPGEMSGTIEILRNARVKPEDHTAKCRYSFHSLDSITIDPWGRVFLEEDPGDATYISRVLMYLPEKDKLFAVAQGNAEVFDRCGTHFLTTNEEVAGIIPVFELLGEGWYLTAIQANVEEDWAQKVLPGLLSYDEQIQLETDLVTPGQLSAMYVPKDATAFLPEIKAESIDSKEKCYGPVVQYAGREFRLGHGD